jgi:hypothetical protein
MAVLFGSSVVAESASATTTLSSPASTVAPTISGTATVGSTLTANTGSWSGFPAPTFTYQWFGCTAAVTTAASSLPTGCVLIASATNGTYSLLPGDVGKFITVKITATNSVSSASKWSVTTGAVAPGSLTTDVPTISGTAAIGQTLTAIPGTWGPAPSFTYQWNAGAMPISGATSATYVPSQNDGGRTISVTITATASGYITTSMTSAPTKIVSSTRSSQVTTDITTDTTWAATETHVVPGNLVIQPGVTLKVTEGTIVKLKGRLTVHGALVVEGTSANPVIFTSFSDSSVGANVSEGVGQPSPGDWELFAGTTGTYAGGPGVESISLDHADIRYAREIYSPEAASLTVTSSTVRAYLGIQWSNGLVSITDSQIDGGIFTTRYYWCTAFCNNADYNPITISRNTVTNGPIQLSSPSSNSSWGNTVSDNTVSGVQKNPPAGGTKQGISVRDGSLDLSHLGGNGAGTNSTSVLFRISGNIKQNQVWPASTPAVTYILEQVTVDGGNTLTVSAGTDVKVGAGGGLHVLGGVVNIDGTGDMPVVMTSLADDSVGGDAAGDGTASLPSSGDWEGIRVDYGGRVNILGTIFKYANTALTAIGGEIYVRAKFVSCNTAIYSDVSIYPSYVDARYIDWDSADGPIRGDRAAKGVELVGPGILSVPWGSMGNSSCTDYTVFGLRGSGEPPQGDGRVDANDGFGNFAKQVARSFSFAVPGTTKFVPIPYSALPVPPDPSAWADYGGSILEGEDSLKKEMQGEITRCPNTYFVVVGYSQGALSAHNLFINLASEPSPLLARIAGVGFVADPWREVDDHVVMSSATDAGGNFSWTTHSPRTPSSRGIAAVGAAAAAAAAVGGAVGGAGGGVVVGGVVGGAAGTRIAYRPIPMPILPVTVELCHYFDAVCDASVTSDLSHHENYSTHELAGLGRALALKVLGKPLPDPTPQ